MLIIFENISLFVILRGFYEELNWLVLSNWGRDFFPTKPNLISDFLGWTKVFYFPLVSSGWLKNIMKDLSGALLCTPGSSVMISEVRVSYDVGLFILCP
jgi:hypothetical protein